MSNTIITNDWTRDDLKKPIIGRPCIVVCEKGGQYLAKWNGFYWVNVNTGLRTMANGLTPKHKVIAWYMYEKYNPNNVL